MEERQLYWDSRGFVDSLYRESRGFMDWFYWDRRLVRKSTYNDESRGNSRFLDHFRDSRHLLEMRNNSMSNRMDERNEQVRWLLLSGWREGSR